MKTWGRLFRADAGRRGFWGRQWLVSLCLGLALLAGCTAIPTEYHEPPKLSSSERSALNQRVFDRAWDLVNDKYFDVRFRGVNWRALRERYRPQAIAATDDIALYAVLNRMCGELKESHLAALSPRRAHEWTTEHRAAVGIRWQLLEGKRVVSDIVPGSPAELAGIKRGWIAISRNGTVIKEGDLFVAHVGEPVAFAFLDEHDQPRTITMTPQLLSFEREEMRVLPGGWTYLRFDRFSLESVSWLSRQLKAHSETPGVIIDLRQNGGGSALALSVSIAEFFPSRVAEGEMVRRSGAVRETRSFSWRSARYRGEVALLVGPASASAAEIFSHVLQHHHRARVLGQRTAGAVIFARTYGLPDGGSIQIPVTDYIGLDGQRLEGRGVTPDELVAPPTLAEIRSGADSAVAAALKGPPRESAGANK